jgi:hypothetical protein
MSKRRTSSLLALIFLSISLASCAPGDTFVAAGYDGPDPQSEAEVEAARRRIELEFRDAVEVQTLSPRQRDIRLSKYQHLDPKEEVPSDLLRTAVLYFDANESRFPNRDYITVVDYTPRSNNYRFFVINMRSGEVEKFRTAHGSGSDQDADGFAERFSNVNGSHMSSLGFVRVAEVYSGKYGRSLRLDGLSETNFRMRARAVVFHGSNYVKEDDRIQGMSQGCLAMDWDVKETILNKIKEGSLMYLGDSAL